MGSSKYLSLALASHSKFEKVIIEEWPTRNKAEAHEAWLHGWYNVATNPIFYNKKNGTVGFHPTAESTAKGVRTKSNPLWKKTTGKAHAECLSRIRSDPKWKATTGKNAIRKEKETKLDPTWKETVGTDQIENYKNIVNDPYWKETKGKEKAQKLSEIQNDPLWKETKGKDKIRKEKETKSSVIWIKNNTFTCEHCGLTMTGKPNYLRWHGDKCRHKK